MALHSGHHWRRPPDLAWPCYASRRSRLLLYGYVRDLSRGAFLRLLARLLVGPPSLNVLVFSFWRFAFVIEDIVSILKLVKVGLVSSFVTIVSTTKLWRLIAICSGFAAILIFLSRLCLGVLRDFSAWLSDISVNASADWYQFIGYVCNFELLYLIFSIYAFSFITACITLLSLYFTSFVFGVFPEAVACVKHILDSLTGD